MVTETKMNLQTIVREIEDVRDARMRKKVERAMLESDFEFLDELAANQIIGGDNLKDRLQELQKNCERESHSAKCAMDIRSDLRKDSVIRVLDMSKVHLEKFKNSVKANKADAEKRFGERLNDYARSHPLLMGCRAKENDFNLLKHYLAKVSEESKVFEKKMKNKMQLRSIMFTQSVVDMANEVLRYYQRVDGRNNLRTKTDKSSRRKLMMPLKAMPLTKLQKPNRSDEQSSIARNARDENPEKRNAVSQHSEQQSRPSSSKVAIAEATNSPQQPKTKRAKVSFGQSTIIGNGLYDAGIETDQPRSKLQKPNRSDEPSTVTKNARDDKAKTVAQQTMPRPSSIKAATEAPSSSLPQKTKGARVSFGQKLSVDVGFSGSGVSKDKPVSSSGFKLATANDMDLEISLENENPMTDSEEIGDGDEMNSGDENSDGEEDVDGEDINYADGNIDNGELIDGEDMQFDDMNGDTEYQDSISIWEGGSPNASSIFNHRSPVSKAPSVDGDDEMESMMDMLGSSDNQSGPPINLSFGNYDIDLS